MSIIVFDMPYLCHRAFYSTGDLSYEGIKTGVIYGVLRDVALMQDQTQIYRPVFCFDSKHSKRKEIYPEYKANRGGKELSEEERNGLSELRRQMNKLRKDYLPEMGYRNVFVQKGYEADDLIAALCDQYKVFDIVIVSTDQDLYQLLNENVCMYKPNSHSYYTIADFKKEYDIDPSWWREVKAIAGCSSDNIPGVAGVGNKTAVKFLSHKLNSSTKAHQAITDYVFDGGGSYEMALRLVKLPYPGVKPLEIQRDKLSKAGWNRVADELGMESLKNKMPVNRHNRR